MRHITLLLLFTCLLGGTNTSAQEDKSNLTRILFIFDASNSMNGKWEKRTKIDVARKVMVQLVDSLRGIDNLHLGLRMYGHQYKIGPNNPQNCEDSKLEVPFSKNNHQKIINKIKTKEPKGTTPIAHSLELSVNDFPDKDARNVIVLITDGVEACEGFPCAVARDLKDLGVTVKPFVVGLDVDISDKDKFNCIGTYFDAVNEKDFAQLIGVVIDQAVNNTTIQIDLNSILGKPEESNVGFSLINTHTKAVEYNYQHTLNHKFNPDTLTVDPTIKYKLVVNTIPPIEIDDLDVIAGKHNTYKLDAAQGHLDLKMKNASGNSVNCIVRQDGKMNTLHVQNFGQIEKYLVGTYDLEVLTLPRLYFNDIKITENKTYKLEIPQEGLLTYESYSFHFAAIYKVEGNKQEWVYNLNPEQANGSLKLLPGKYKIVYRDKRSSKTLQSETQFFTIYSGEKKNIKL